MDRFKLIALDGDDLAVVSAQLHDARARLADIRWQPANRRLVIGLERCDWDAVLDGENGAADGTRIVSALRFERVVSCQSRGLDKGNGEAVHLLGIEFAPAAAPGGTVHILFAGGGVLRAEVECIECELADLGRAGA